MMAVAGRRQENNSKLLVEGCGDVVEEYGVWSLYGVAEHLSSPSGGGGHVVGELGR